MNVRIDRRNGLVAVREPLSETRVALHKFTLVNDGKRKGINYGKHADSKQLVRSLLDHEWSMQFIDGHPRHGTNCPDHVIQYLQELGAEVSL